LSRICARPAPDSRRVIALFHDFIPPGRCRIQRRRSDLYVLYEEDQGGEGLPVAHWLNPDEQKAFKKANLIFR